MPQKRCDTCKYWEGTEEGWGRCEWLFTDEPVLTQEKERVQPRIFTLHSHYCLDHKPKEDPSGTQTL
jgi:hypothetical protein